MQDDHYVAQTYLRHFVGQSGLLCAFRKSDGRSFPCRPRDVCCEPDGDIIPDFLSEPEYLGDYRSAFEPSWNRAVSSLKAHSIGMRDKLNIAGYWANLLVCTPTWRRIGIETYNQNTLHVLRSQAELSRQIGKPDQKLSEAIEALDRGEIKVETESDYIRAQSARSLLQHAWGLYNADWDVFENDTEIEYVTSDNPASLEDQGDAVTGGLLPYIRYLPVTPRLCIMCDLTQNPRAAQETPDFQREPKGTIRGGFVRAEMIHRINISVAKCAEELVLSSRYSDYVCDLTAKYSNFRVEHQSMRVRMPRGFLLQNRTRVVERAQSRTA